MYTAKTKKSNGRPHPATPAQDLLGLTAGAERHLFGGGAAPVPPQGVAVGPQAMASLPETNPTASWNEGASLSPPGGARGAPRPRKVPSSILTASHAVPTGPAPSLLLTRSRCLSPRPPRPRGARQRRQETQRGPAAHSPARVASGHTTSRAGPAGAGRAPTGPPYNSRQSRDPSFSDPEAQGEHLRGPSLGCAGRHAGRAGGCGERPPGLPPRPHLRAGRREPPSPPTQARATGPNRQRLAPSAGNPGTAYPGPLPGASRGGRQGQSGAERPL